jgi:hypothetical protein
LSDRAELRGAGRKGISKGEAHMEGGEGKEDGENNKKCSRSEKKK